MQPVSFAIVLAQTVQPVPTPSPGPILFAPGATELLTLTVAMAALTAVALLLGLIAGTFVYVLEGLLLRWLLNKRLVRQWARGKYEQLIPKGDEHNARIKAATNALLDRLSPQWQTLPPKQFAGAIAAAFQVSEPDFAPRSGESLREQFEKIGRSLLKASPEWVRPPQSDPKEDLESLRIAESLYYAERALDDLQARLSARWMLNRFVLGAIVIVLFSTLVSAVNTSKTLGFFGALVTYWLIWVVAALFAPIFRDLAESLSNRRA